MRTSCPTPFGHPGTRITRLQLQAKWRKFGQDDYVAMQSRTPEARAGICDNCSEIICLTLRLLRVCVFDLAITYYVSHRSRVISAYCVS